MKRWNLSFLVSGVLLVSLSLTASCVLADDLAEEDLKPAYVAPTFSKPTVSGNPLLVDWFDDVNALDKKWIRSRGKKDDVEDSIAKYNGEWQIGAPTKNVIDGDMGLIVKTKARHHAIAARFSRPFTFTDNNKPLVAQYEVKYEDGQECGGGYIKLLTVGAENKLSEFTDKTAYTIMFGPDKCGQTAKVHFIIRFTNPKNGSVSEHHAKSSNKPVASYFDDRHSHLYTLIVKPDNSYKVLVDNSEIMSGSLLTDLEPSITPPSKIDDPSDVKPDDWDEREKIQDPDAKKPDDWDENAPKEIEDESATKPDDWLEDEPEHVPDPEAKKPEDWDEEMDGQWEAPLKPNPKCEGRSGCGPWKRPMILNPNYKGKWTAPMIANPAYKGKWQARQIDNPNYFEPKPYHQLSPISALGIELWTMSANIIIDNIYIDDSIERAADFAAQTFTPKQNQEQVYESAMSPDEGVIRYLLDSAEQRPWLWAVYILTVLVPVIVIALVCFGRKGRSSGSEADYKKTDEPQPDDEVPDLVGDDDDEQQPEPEPEDADVAEETAADNKRESGDEARDRSKSPARRHPSKEQHRSKSPARKPKTTTVEESNKTKDDLEQKQSAASSSGTEEDVGAAGSIEGSSPKGKRVRQRRQD